MKNFIINKKIVYILSALIIICVICACGKVEAKENYKVDEEIKSELITTNIGIGGGGMLHSPVIGNFDSNTVIVSTDMGGIYVSHDIGLSWKRKNLKGTVITTYSDPNREGVFYAGGSGLWRSTDNGDSFELIFPNKEDLIERINMNENGIHYLFTKSKVYPITKYIKNVIVNPNNSDNIFVLAYYGKEGKVYESTDNGENFVELFTYKQEKPDGSIFYDLHKLFYKQETDELYLINDEEVLKYDREKKQAISIYKTETNLINAVSVFENNKTEFIVIEESNEIASCETKVYYTNDFNNKTDLTEKIIAGQKNEFNYDNKIINFKWKFKYIDATSLNNIYVTQNAPTANYPWNITAILKYDGEKSIYLYGVPFRNHNNIKDKGWADGNTGAYGIAISRQNPDMLIETTLVGVNYFPNNTDIYQRYTTPIKDGNITKYVTSGIEEQTTYGVRIDPFNEEHILLLNTDLGLISSEDNCASWTRCNTGIKSAWSNTIYDAEFDKNKEGVVYSIWGGRHDAPYYPQNETDSSVVHGGFAISTDSGKTWNSNYSSGIPENTTPVKLGIVYPEDPTKEVTIYIATFKHGFFVSYDSGKTFTELNDGIEKVSYKNEDDYKYILASDIEVKDGRVFGITAKSSYGGKIQPGEVFELINNKWQKIDLLSNEVGKNVKCPRDIYYNNGTLYISSTCTSKWDYKEGRDFSNYGGGIITYKDGQINQIFDESISTTGVQIDSFGNLYVSDINGNIYRRANGSEEFVIIYEDYHSISKGIQLINDDTIYLSAFGGGVLKIENLPKENKNTYNFTESIEEFNNPDMGFYQPTGIRVKATGEWDKVYIGRPDGLVHLRLGLKSFTKKANGVQDYDITDEHIKKLNECLQIIREAGGTTVVRFAYDDFLGERNLEPEIDQILKHIEQLKPFFEQNEDIIATVETGFLGPWGEQHSSKIVTPENLKKITLKLLEVVPDSRTVSVRRPLWYCHVTDKNIGDIAEDITIRGNYDYRIGVFNDGYLGSKSDTGTFVDRKKEITWLSNQAKHTLYGGETLPSSEKDENGFEFSAPEHIRDEMFITHTSYLNEQWNYNLVQSWKKTTYTGQDELYKNSTNFTYIKNHLGYRLVLNKVTIPKKVETSDKLDLNINLKNVGAGNVVNEKKAYIILKNNENEYYIETNLDVRDWDSREEQNINLNLPTDSNMIAGNYDVYLKIANAKDDEKTNKRTIRFANNDVWNKEIGANKLGEIEIIKKPIVEVLGDIDQDGSVTINDLAILKLHIIGKTLIDEKLLPSADIDKSSSITINDLALMKLTIIGKNK